MVTAPESQATLTINSRNYGAWSLRGWLLCKFSGLDFVEKVIDSHDPAVRAELLQLSPSFLVPRLDHDGVTVWDTLAIGEYLHEIFPDASLFPADVKERAWCRSICGEVHGGFAQLRSALPMNIKTPHENFKVFSGAQADIDRILAIWQDCVSASGGPFLFGGSPTVADAMYAPVCTRFISYDVEIPDPCRGYLNRIMALPEMIEWVGAAKAEPDNLSELDVEF